MKEFKYVVTDAQGNPRKTGRNSGKSNCEKTSDIKIKKAGDTREVNAKSIMAVMSLGVKKGNEVIITAEGEDEEEAIAEIQKVLEENL